MKSDDQIKQIVKDKYGEIAIKQPQEGCGCCGTSKVVDYSMFKDSYDKMEGYVPEADMGLGCGLPTEFANIKKGDTVVDLGAGAGNDVFVARAVIGETGGKVIGIDMTQEMIDKANENKAKLGYDNIEFKFGEIESMPIHDNEVDVVVSNCVLNLVPNKDKAFEEIYRILKPEGHFCVSDIVLQGQLTEGLTKSAEMYAGCVAGALQKEEYLNAIQKAGFKNIEIKKTKTIELPDELLKEYLSDSEIEEYKDNKVGIFSITVVADKN